MRLRILDTVSAWGLVLLGCVHNFVAAPSIYPELSERAFWFVGAGLALWYAGAINLVRQSAPGLRAARVASLFTNATLLALVVAFGIHTGAAGSAGGLILIGLVGRHGLLDHGMVRSVGRGRDHSARLGG